MMTITFSQRMTFPFKFGPSSILSQRYKDGTMRIKPAINAPKNTNQILRPVQRSIKKVKNKMQIP